MICIICHELCLHIRQHPICSSTLSVPLLCSTLSQAKLNRVWIKRRRRKQAKSFVNTCKHLKQKTMSPSARPQTIRRLPRNTVPNHVVFASDIVRCRDLKE
ncbi:hypothetical protein V3C99_006691 [Haemonchus contortus]|uniref:Secreted protein n=1 Tax=Haemonchus contortus TaxID=6289 RepID=A0A7I4YRU5_HAECO